MTSTTSTILIFAKTKVVFFALTASKYISNYMVFKQ